MNAESNNENANISNPLPSNGTTGNETASNSSIITAIRQSRLSNQQMQALEQLLEKNPSSMSKLISDYSHLSPQQLEQEFLRLVQNAELEALSLPPQMVITPPSTAKPSEDFKVAWDKMSQSNPKDPLNSSARAIAKLIQGARRNPQDPKHRRIRMDNIIAKKFITKINGADDFMHSIGFRNTLINNIAYLELEEGKVNLDLLNQAETFLLEHSTGVDELFSGSSSAISSPAMAPQTPKIRPRCAAGCGFFGDEATESLCSQCFKKKYASPSVKPEEKSKSVPKRKTWKAKFHMAAVKLRAFHRFRLGIKERPVQKNKSKCWICKKKIGILGFECRCGYTFCEDHRYANQHDCVFDFHKAHQKKLLRENQALKENKLARLSEDTDD